MRKTRVALNMNDHFRDCIKRGKSGDICVIHTIMDAPSKVFPGQKHRELLHPCDQVETLATILSLGSETRKKILLAEGYRHRKDDGLEKCFIKKK